ncbi:hypothetical protein FPOAC1_001881 [Fusarium poae]|uniref:hypothetical protein n=1 Tax=Fusarium poae TaxID=36050 RepID=UPI001CEA0AAF|nr:hypothetical protein FPOAC1_001881 [Fusarium poae]KAG8675886.1 hypothetical protein FPOAC1_001881 [Fusarium poae]
MRSLFAYTLLASATLSVAVDPRFEYPDTVPLVKRQQPGLLITLARENKDFCDSQEWNEHYDKCMECAETYGIWKYYGSGVSKVAEQCDLSPTPSPSGAAVEKPASSTDGSGTTVPAETTTEVPAEATSTITAIESTTPMIHPVTTTPEASSGADSTTSVETATSTPEPSSVAVNGAAKHFEFTTVIAFVAFTICSLY